MCRFDPYLLPLKSKRKLTVSCVVVLLPCTTMAGLALKFGTTILNVSEAELAKVFDRGVNLMLGADMVGNRRLTPI